MPNRRAYAKEKEISLCSAQRFGELQLGRGIVLLPALGVRKLFWIVNLLYVAVICWDLFVLIALAVRRH
jgi:hypothetical protein